MFVSSDNFSSLIITVFRECNMIYTVLLLGLFTFYLEVEAGITFSSQTGNVTYWSAGSTVRLPWDYDFKASDVLSRAFYFIASGSSTRQELASVGITTTTKPRVTLTDKGTLSLSNAQLSDNGTYIMEANVKVIGSQSDSVLVIILEQPQAATNCSQPIEVSEGDDVICLCYNTSGNPPPTASWSKEGSSGVIDGYGYLEKLLILKNIKASQKGKYICQVRSHTLKSEVSIQVTVRFKPKIDSFESGDTKGIHTAFLGRKVTITCKASGDPSPLYIISHNGTNLTDVVNGVKTIDPVNYRRAGVYKCVAVNKLGSDSDSFTLIVKVLTTYTTTQRVQITTTEQVFRECNMIYTVLLLGLLLFYLEVEAGITFSSQTGNVTYWSRGSTVRLPWDYDFKASDVLSKSFEFVQSRSTTIKALAIIGITTTKDPRVTLTDKGTLGFPAAQLSDNGTYTFKVNVDKIGIQSDSVLVIILDQPTAKASCSGEGDNASCLCEGKGGNPPADTTWLKGNKKIKDPEHLSTAIVKKDITTNGEGEYTCKANSNNLTHEDSVTLSKPKEISFKSEMVTGKIKLVCQVVGTITPAPVYFISFNGSVAKEYKNGVKVIGKVDSCSVGQYKCLAKNVLGNAIKHLFLNAHETVPTTHTTTPSVQITTTERAKIISDNSCTCGTEWYLFLITLICGIIVGMVVLYAIMWLRLRLSKKRNHSKPSQPGAVAGPSGEGLENASAYQELDLQKMNKSDDNYQSLRMTSRNARSNTEPVEIENEAGYQELNEVRGNTDDNYQPLNRV